MVGGVNKSETWYEATVARGEPLPGPVGAADADVCVIGGGLAGLTTALELQRRGKRVVLLEAQRIAWGASGRNGGFVFNGFARGMDEVAAVAGLDAAKGLYRLSRHGTEYVRRETAALAPMRKWATVSSSFSGSTTQRPSGRARKPRRSISTRIWRSSRSRRRARFSTPSSIIKVCVQPRAFHIHPLRYALALASEARWLGALHP